MYFIHACDHHAAESWAHQRLAEYRKSRGKEFFTAPLLLAVKTLGAAAERLPVMVGRKTSARVVQQPLGLVEFSCPHCGKANRIRELLIDVRVKCGGCGKHPLRSRRSSTIARRSRGRTAGAAVIPLESGKMSKWILQNVSRSVARSTP